MELKTWFYLLVVSTYYLIPHRVHNYNKYCSKIYKIQIQSVNIYIVLYLYTYEFRFSVVKYCKEPIIKLGFNGDNEAVDIDLSFPHTNDT